MVRAEIIGETRALARGPSGMLIASTPASAHCRALASSAVMSLDFGGELHRRHLLPAHSSPRGGTPLGRHRVDQGFLPEEGFTSTRRFPARSGFTARAAIRMCAGVVPQHPPRPGPQFDELPGVLGEIPGSSGTSRAR